ncbi:hypothetical protein ACFO1B_01330 [Dactylosporangium siamense]|nr:hypothetical protein [Dactylosporangium siamense]
MDEAVFDRLVVAGIGGIFAVLLGARLLGAEWVVPPEDGVGGFPSTGRAVLFWTVAVVALVGMAACLMRQLSREWRGFPTMLLGIPLLFGSVLVLGEPIYNSHQLDLRADGCTTDRYELMPKNRVRLFNVSDTTYTVCLGRSGECTPAAAGPAVLLSLGITLPPNHRRAVTMPEQVGEYRLTIVGAGASVTPQDLVINISDEE